MFNTAAAPVSSGQRALPSVPRGLAYLAFAGITWGTTGAAIELVYRSSDLGPMAVSFWRFLAGAALLMVAGRFGRARTSRPASRQRALLLIGTGIGLAVFQTAYFAALPQTGLAISTIVTLGSAPLFSVAGGRLFLIESVGRGGLLTIAGAVLGLAVLVFGNHQVVVHPLGVGFALLSAAGYAVSNVLGRWTGRHGTGEEPYSLTMWSFAIGAFVMLPFALGEGLWPHTRQVLNVVVPMTYVATVTTALAYPLYFAGAAIVRAATASVVMLIEPVSAAVVAVLLLGERITWATVGGTTVLVGAIAGLAMAEARMRAPEVLANMPDETG